MKSIPQTNLITNLRLKESLRDNFLSFLEFVEIVKAMNNNFSRFEKQRRMLANKKYSVILGNVIDEYGSELIALNEKYIHSVAQIQKKFLGEDDCSSFIEDFCKDVEDINQNIQVLRDSPYFDNSKAKIEFVEKLNFILEDFFPIVPGRRDRDVGKGYFDDEEDDDELDFGKKILNFFREE